MVGFWKTFSGVLDAWILHNSDQNFILLVILTRCIHDIANQLLTRHLPSASLSQVDEWTAEPSTFSIRSRLLEFFQIMAAKTLKKSVLLTESDVQTFLEGEENQNTERKTESYVFSDFGNGISRSWERKSTSERFATGRFWPCSWKISSIGKNQANNWEFFILKITLIVCSCSFSTHFFILSLGANALYDFYSGIVDPFISIH